MNASSARPVLGVFSPRSVTRVIVPLLLFVTACGGDSGPEASNAVLPEVREALDVAREPIPLDRTEPVPIRVYASPTCGCCSLWVEHMQANGFEVETVYRDDLATVKASFGVPRGLESCHTGVVNGYVVEGHVPADDLRRFLAEAPEARGLAVPGMPIGSPGMEMGDRVDPYDVMLFRGDGSTSVWARHGR